MTYIVREHINADDPTSQGTELKRFKDWQEAKDYSDNLWKQDKIKSYISEELQEN